MASIKKAIFVKPVYVGDRSCAEVAMTLNNAEETALNALIAAKADGGYEIVKLYKNEEKKFTTDGYGDDTHEAYSQTSEGSWLNAEVSQDSVSAEDLLMEAIGNHELKQQIDSVR